MSHRFASLDTENYIEILLLVFQIQHTDLCSDSIHKVEVCAERNACRVDGREVAPQ